MNKFVGRAEKPTVRLQTEDMAFVFSRTGAQRDFPAGVGEVVISGCLNSRGIKPFYSRREKTLAAENMERLGIAGLKNSSFITVIFSYDSVRFSVLISAIPTSLPIPNYLSIYKNFS